MNTTVHGFRHAHAVQLRKSGWDMEQIRRQLGHSSLAVTGQYLDHLGVSELSEKMRSERWGIAAIGEPEKDADDPRMTALIEALGEEKAMKLGPLLLD